MAYDGVIRYNLETRESEWLFQNLPIMDMEIDPEGFLIYRMKWEEGNLWLASNKGLGKILLTNEEMTWFTTRDGLSANVIYDLNFVGEQHSSHLSKRVEVGHYECAFSRIALTNSSGFQFVEIKDILYLAADGMYTHLTMRNGEVILVSKPLVDFERLLQENKSFFKVHRKYIINLNHMSSFTRGTSEIEMEGGAHIPLSRHRKQEFEEEIHSLIPGRAERG